MKTSILVAALFLSTNLRSATPLRSLLTQRDEPQCPQSRDSESDRQLLEQKVSKIVVRIVSLDNDNLGSGVLIGRETTSGTTYLVLTNQHVIRGKEVRIETYDRKQYPAKPLNKTLSSSSKLEYDIALLEFDSPQSKYDIANLKYDTGSSLIRCREIYSAGFPYDADKISIGKAYISQIPPTIPLDNGTQIPYQPYPKENDLQAGMSGGPIFMKDNNDNNNNNIVIGINATAAGAADPIYTSDNKPVPIKKNERYDQSNWGIPIYNILTTIPNNILDRYKNLPKLQHQVMEGYIKDLSKEKFWNQTVRIDYDHHQKNGSGVIIGQEEDKKTKTKTYYVLTAKHVITVSSDDPVIPPKKYVDDIEIMTSHERVYRVAHDSIIPIPDLDLAILPFKLKLDDRPYKIAPLGNYKPIDDAPIFVSGFPAPRWIDSPLYQWQLNPGRIVSEEHTLIRMDNSGRFLYTNITNDGMSGSPVFDPDGRLVGIHAGEDLFLGNSIGIQIQSFINFVKNKNKYKYKYLQIETNPPRQLTEDEMRSVDKLTSQTIILKPENEDSSNSIKWSQYGNQCLRSNRYDEAIEAFDSAIKINDKEANIYFRRGEAKLSRNDRRSAISDFDRAIELNREKPSAYTYFRRGEVKLILKENKEAIKDFDEAIKLNPKYSYAYLSRAQAKFQQDKEGAIKDLDEAIKLNPEYLSIYFNRNGVDSFKENIKIANLYFDRAIKLNPKYPYIYGNRGESKSALGDNKGAIEDFDRAIKLNPNYAYAYGNRGQSKSALGDNKEAVLDFDRAIQLNPNYGAAYLRRGEAKLSLEDRQGAISDLTSAKNLFKQQGRTKLYDETKQQLDKIIKQPSIPN
jgi:tetratricopeptide (TPR) repeat protein